MSVARQAELRILTIFSGGGNWRWIYYINASISVRRRKYHYRICVGKSGSHVEIGATMFKIASCIFIAVCINFQQVVAAASFPYSLGSLGSREVFGPLGSLLDNTKDTILDAKYKISDVKDKVSDVQDEMLNVSFADILQNIIEQKDEALQNINNMSDMDKEIGTKISTGLQKIKDKGVQFMEEAQNIPACNRVYNIQYIIQ
ncbi:uncharacterized protein LOC105190708 [Harpegnathos saltator]|uniref:uncharacterized protein LOC105190708 n=1 Tax=Harpegnathos saltator TaxID=610380 RepID=UPI000DBED175|nr:uncharacterized protein LOC105190708 [Harpegnathos saltator]